MRYEQPPHRNRLAFYATEPHACAYLDQRQAVTLFADPHARLTNQIYGELAPLGFRRSGRHIYRPACHGCHACIPARIPVERFAARRRHRRVWNANSDLTVVDSPPVFRREHFTLYHRYMATRHPDGGMDDADTEQYMDFLTCGWSKTRFIEFRLNADLLGVAVIDLMPDALSAVYTFFDPDFSKRSLGIFAILWQIEHARSLDLSHVYLGYWIRESHKMAYKGDFQPLECFMGGRWQLNAEQDDG